MTDTKDCTRCAMFVAGPPTQDASGSCRQNPPVPVVVGMDTQMGRPRPITMAFWPGVKKGDWCGQFKQKITIQ